MHAPESAPSPGRRPPQQQEAERAILGAILLSNDALHAALEQLEPDDFYRPQHKLIFQAMIDLSTRREPIDIVTLQAELKTKGELEAVGGAGPLIELASAVPTAANVPYYAELVRQAAILRRVIDAAGQIAEKAFDGSRAEEVLDHAEKNIFEIGRARAKKSLTPVVDVVKDAFARIEQLYHDKRAITGVSTGYTEIDHKTAGLQPADLIIVAGRPSMGKTAFSLNLATNSARTGSVVAVFSLEMSKEQLVMRMLCSEARIDASRMRGGFLSESDWPKLAKAAATISEAPMYIDDTGSASVIEVRAKCRRLAAEHGLGLVVVDYLQLMRGGAGAQSREQEISEISRGLKSLAKELNIPVIALSQLNRSLESRTDKRPVLSDLRESGAIEQDADVIMFVYRDEVYNPETEHKGVAEIIIGKQRNGPIGTCRLRFFHEFTRFDNLAE